MIKSRQMAPPRWRSPNDETDLDLSEEEKEAVDGALVALEGVMLELHQQGVLIAVVKTQTDLEDFFPR